MGGITSAVAVHKGRSAVGWFFVGFLTGCIGLIIILCLPNVKDQGEMFNTMELETRKLREQLTHERLRNESFQTHVRHRIDTHDVALGMNTRALGPGRPPARPILPGPASVGGGGGGGAAAVSTNFTGCEWFVKFGARKSQPLSFEKLKRFWEIGNLTPDTLVCTSENEEWVPVHQVPGLLEELNANLQT